MKKITLLILVLISTNFAFGVESKGIFYKASKNEKNIYLLGSIHIAHSDIFPIDKNIEELFDKTENIVMEIDELDSEKQQAMMETIMSKLFYFNGDKLENHISKESVELLKKYFKEAMGIEGYADIYKPWAALFMLETLQLSKIYGENIKGVELYFLKRIQGKKLVGLETVEEQLKLLTDYTDEEVDKSIKLSTSIQELEKEVKKMEEAWKLGDEKALDDIVNQSMNDIPSLQKRMLTDRNRKWIGLIERMLEEKKDIFVIVGAAHLVGNESVVKLLKENGYKIEKGN